jgi:hypothetical protein
MKNPEEVQKETLEKLASLEKRTEVTEKKLAGKMIGVGSLNVERYKYHYGDKNEKWWYVYTFSTTGSKEIQVYLDDEQIKKLIEYIKWDSK